MSGIIDFHSHVLPGIDDGSKSVEQSIAMLKREAEQGITHVVATPHFYPRQDLPERFLQRRYESEMRLREEMAKYVGLPELTVGAEVYYFPGISESDAVFQLTIGGKRSILLEMALAPWTDRMYREMEELVLRRDLTVIVAHVDRYISPFRTHGIPNRLEQLPVLVQANAEFFLRRSTASMAMRMLKQGKIHLLGSDCHNLTSRKPNLGAAVDLIRSQLGPRAIAEICACEKSILEEDHVS